MGRIPRLLLLVVVLLSAALHGLAQKDGSARKRNCALCEDLAREARPQCQQY